MVVFKGICYYTPILLYFISITVLEMVGPEILESFDQILVLGSHPKGNAYWWD